MRRAGVALLVLGLGLSCGGPFIAPGACCSPTMIERDRVYAGEATTDGGEPASVSFIVSSSGEARITFVRDGGVITQFYRPP